MLKGNIKQTTPTQKNGFNLNQSVVEHTTLLWEDPGIQIIIILICAFAWFILTPDSFHSKLQLQMAKTVLYHAQNTDVLMHQKYLVAIFLSWQLIEGRY